MASPDISKNCNSFGAFKPGTSLESVILESVTSQQEIQFDEVYEIHDEICSGFFGTVYTGKHVDTDDNIVAIKVIDRHRHNTDDVLQEVSIMRDLTIAQTPNVVQLIDFYMDEHNIYVVQNYVSGGDVLDQLSSRQTYCEEDARKLAHVLLSVIDSLHTKHNMCHRDIKPENLLLQNVDDDSSLMLCDFGYATYMPRNDSSETKDDDSMYLCTYAGTLSYMAPEIVTEQLYRGEAVDMWSIGCSLFILLGGYQAFEDVCEVKTVEHIANCDYGGFDDEPAWDAISDEAKDLIAHLLVTDSKQRWNVKEALNCDWFQDIDTDDEEENQEQLENFENDEKIDDFFNNCDRCCDFKEEGEGDGDITEHSFSGYDVFNLSPVRDTPKKNDKFDRSIHLHTTFSSLRKYCTKRKLKAAVHAITFSKLLQLSIHEKENDDDSTATSSTSYEID